MFADNEINGDILQNTLKPHFKNVKYDHLLYFNDAFLVQRDYDLIICDISNATRIVLEIKGLIENSKEVISTPILLIVDRDVPLLHYLRSKEKIQIVYKPCKWNQLYSQIKTSLFHPE